MGKRESLITDREVEELFQRHEIEAEIEKFLNLTWEEKHKATWDRIDEKINAILKMMGIKTTIQEAMEEIDQKQSQSSAINKERGLFDVNNLGEDTSIEVNQGNSLEIFGMHNSNCHVDENEAFHGDGVFLKEQMCDVFHPNQPKLELPVFCGENPREWLKKCNKFFTTYQIQETGKMDVIKLYLDDRVEIWFEGLQMVRGQVSWAVFSDALVKRFEAKGVEEFNKMVQERSVLDQGTRMVTVLSDHHGEGNSLDFHDKVDVDKFVTFIDDGVKSYFSEMNEKCETHNLGDLKPFEIDDSFYNTDEECESQIIAKPWTVYNEDMLCSNFLVLKGSGGMDIFLKLQEGDDSCTIHTMINHHGFFDSSLKEVGDFGTLKGCEELHVVAGRFKEMNLGRTNNIYVKTIHKSWVKVVTSFRGGTSSGRFITFQLQALTFPDGEIKTLDYRHIRPCFFYNEQKGKQKGLESMGLQDSSSTCPILDEDKQKHDDDLKIPAEVDHDGDDIQLHKATFYSIQLSSLTSNSHYGSKDGDYASLKTTDLKQKEICTSCEVEPHDFDESRTWLRTQQMREASWYVGMVCGDEEPALIWYTSGTIGKPKGVVHMHRSILAQVQIVASAWEYSSSDQCLHCLPLHHIHGPFNALLALLDGGYAVEFMPKFMVKGNCQRWHELYLAKEIKVDDAIIVFTGAPTMNTRLIHSYEAMDPELQPACAAAASLLRLMMCGSSAPPLSVMRHWKTITGYHPLESYGMTEFVMAISNPLRGVRKGGTIGKSCLGVQVKILGADCYGIFLNDGNCHGIFLNDGNLEDWYFSGRFMLFEYIIDFGNYGLSVHFDAMELLVDNDIKQTKETFKPWAEVVTKFKGGTVSEKLLTFSSKFGQFRHGALLDEATRAVDLVLRMMLSTGILKSWMSSKMHFLMTMNFAFEILKVSAYKMRDALIFDGYWEHTESCMLGHMVARYSSDHQELVIGILWLRGHLEAEEIYIKAFSHLSFFTSSLEVKTVFKGRSNVMIQGLEPFS